MISAGVAARTADGHGIFDRKSGELINGPGDIIIGEHVWVGNGVRISKDVKIHAGSIIGQESIVTKDIEANTVNVGVPARAVRSDVVWSRRGPYDDIPVEFR